MKKWQQLKIQLEPATGCISIAEASIGVVREFVELVGEQEIFTLDHVDWLGWELVTVVKNSLYYKRPFVEG